MSEVAPPPDEGDTTAPDPNREIQTENCIEVCHVDVAGTTKCVKLDCPSSDMQAKVDWKVTEAWLDWVRQFFAYSFNVSPESDFALVEATTGIVFSLNQTIPNGKYFLSQAWPVMTLPIQQLGGKPNQPQPTSAQGQDRDADGGANRSGPEESDQRGKRHNFTRSVPTSEHSIKGGDPTNPETSHRVVDPVHPKEVVGGGESAVEGSNPSQPTGRTEDHENPVFDYIETLCCQSPSCFCCCKQRRTNKSKDTEEGCTVLVSAKATVLPGSAKWALVKMEMIVDVICDEKTHDTALEFAEIRIGKSQKNPEDDAFPKYIGWKFNSAEPQNEEKTRVVNKNQGWEGGAAIGYKRASPLVEVTGKTYRSQQWTDEVEEWRTIFSPSDMIREDIRSVKKEARAQRHHEQKLRNEEEEQTCSWVVCLNKENGKYREMYPSTATHCLRKYFAVVLEVQRLIPVEINGFGPNLDFEPEREDPTLLRIPISCLYRKRIWNRCRVCGWSFQNGWSHLSNVGRVSGYVDFELFWAKFSGAERSFPILRQESKLASEGMWQLLSIDAFIKAYDSKPFQDKLQKLTRWRGKSLDWAKKWAEPNNPDYEDLNECRKILLNLLFNLYNFFHSRRRSEEAIRQACDRLDEKKVKNILDLCLPMDRANCLYHMTIGGRKPGMHWISEDGLKHYNWVKHGYPGYHSINKRYEWIIDKFHLTNDQDIRRWLTPIVIRDFIAEENHSRIQDIDSFDGGKFDNEKFGLVQRNDEAKSTPRARPCPTEK